MIRRAVQGLWRTPFRPVVDGLARKAYRYGTDHCHQWMLLIGAPRSGTTWLLEILEEASGARRVWEPLMPFAQRGVVGWRPYLAPDGDSSDESIRQVVATVTSGRGLTAKELGGGNPRHTAVEQLYRLLWAPRTIVKSCRAQRLIPWLNENTDCSLILMVRHPAAVVASQLYHPEYASNSGEDGDRVAGVPDEVLERWPEIEVESGLTTCHERLAATWAADYKIALNSISRVGEGNALVFYEDLVRRPRETLQLLYDDLDMPPRMKVFPDTRTPSGSTVADSNVVRGDDPLATWRRRLSRDQAEEILSVSRSFGIELYDEGLCPRVSRLTGADGVEWPDLC